MKSAKKFLLQFYEAGFEVKNRASFYQWIGVDDGGIIEAAAYLMFSNKVVSY